MPIFKYFKNLKSFSIIIVPDDTSHEAKSKKFTVTKIFIFAVIYSILIAVLGYYFFNITGIGNRVLPGTYVQNEGNIFGVFISFIQNLFSQQQDNTIFFILPVNGYISRDFDPDRGHYGIDIVVKDGTPVYASAGGFVVFSGYTNNYGNIIILNHSDGYLSIYKHCSVILKKEREFVKQGELIAQSGNSGLATTGPHLHFEIWHNGKPVDPENLLIINK